jgi:hypothetical protein
MVGAERIGSTFFSSSHDDQALAVKVVEDDRSSGFSEVSAAKAQHGQKQWMILTSVAGSYQWILDRWVY